MIGLVRKNSDGAISTVVYSVFGSIGIIGIISTIAAYQVPDGEPSEVFSQYFSGGQLGLTILSISGAIFAALLSRPPMPRWLSLVLYGLFIVPMLATGFIIGLNPGFVAGGLGSDNLWLLWVFFILFHALWLILLLIEPEIPSAQEVGKEQQNRVNSILNGGK